MAESLRGIVGVLDPKDVALSWAPEVMAAFGTVERYGAAGRMLMTARAAQAGQWERERFASPADWLAAEQGTTSGRARADLETSERLEGLEATSGAVREGRLSPEQAGAVADAASVNPDAEKDLLEHAERESLRRTREEAERRKAEARSEEEKAARDGRVRRQRDMRFWYRDGAGHGQFTGPVADVKALEEWINRHVDRKFRENRDPARRQSRGNYAFDALVGAAQGGDTAGGKGSKGRPPLTRMTLIRVDLAALMRGWVGVGELCEIGGVPVSVTELRKVLGESILQLVLSNGEAVVDVVNLSRTPTVAQKIAKLFESPTCCVEGCDRSARIEFDHRVEWSKIKTTELANLDNYCDHHHDLKTFEGWKLVPGTGRRPMVPPDDPRHPDYGRTTPAGVPRRVAGESADERPEEGRRRDAGDLVGRVAGLKSRGGERRARSSGQDTLFDTG